MARHAVGRQVDPRRRLRLLTLAVILYSPADGPLDAADPAAPAVTAAAVDFNRDIRPILSAHCFECHGPDAGRREAELRLDTRQGAMAKRQGHSTIAAGEPQHSELFRRITAKSVEQRMPPKESNRPLSKKQIELIRRWISQGAPWQEHWAWITPTRPSLPSPADYLDFVRSPVDRFLLERHYANGLLPSRPAGRVTLIRRAHLDLLGLPPTPKQVDEFLADDRPGAWRRLVDRLLDSQHYGERMAIYWLDVVRYADSNGYHSDEARQIAPYRDYVIEAFNGNMRFDRFVTEQLAGDLLKGASADSNTKQKIASGFNMLLQTTSEGGAQAKEYLAKYSADRVRNTSSIFLGVTLGCAQCHDHKYDPFTSNDFYRFASFFADISEKGVGNPPTYPIRMGPTDKSLADLDKQIAQLQKSLDTSTPNLVAAQAKWEAALAAEVAQAAGSVTLSAWSRIGPFPADNFETAHAKAFGPEQDFTKTAQSQLDLNQTYDGLKWSIDKRLVDGKPHALNGQNCATYLFRTITSAKARRLAVSLGSDDSIKLWLNGTLKFENKVLRGVAPDQDKTTLNLVAGENRLLLKVANAGGGYGFFFRLQPSSLPAAVLSVLNLPTPKRTPAHKQLLAAHFRSIAPTLNPVRNRLAVARKQKSALENSLPRTLMTVSIKPRPIRLLPRGNWMDDSGPIVEPGVPGFLPLLDVKDRRANRLDLARWIVRKDNPLAARTFVNRLWKLYFGRGLATPLDDLGAQGTRPTYPLLLDWLAVEFIESGWDVKHMVRLMVNSGAYRQSSMTSPVLGQRDPYNTLLARQGRFRLDAEIVRDNALAVSGLLVTDIGGPSVKPYQPAGYWRHMNFPVRSWKASTGQAVYRRGLYTWWQRMFLHPSLLAFDAPSREECTVERPRSNTPQQALVLLNDPTYVEAAAALAERIVNSNTNSFEARLDQAFRQVLSRRPRPQEVHILRSVYDRHLADYQADPAAARNSLTAGRLKPPPKTSDSDVALRAAWMSMARILLNLHETITRS
jgi:mono/diheme cytochrome c family protein